MQALVKPTQCHGSRFGALSLDQRGAAETKGKLLFVSHFFSPKHLRPKGRHLVAHAHDSIGELGFEQTRNQRLASKGHVKGQIGGVFGIHGFSVHVGFGCHEGGLVRPGHVTLIHSLVGVPPRSLGVTHTDLAGIVLTIRSAHNTIVIARAFRFSRRYDPQSPKETAFTSLPWMPCSFSCSTRSS